MLRGVTMDKVQKMFLIIGLILILLNGFTITIGNFKWIFRGLISLVLRIIYGEWL